MYMYIYIYLSIYLYIYIYTHYSQAGFRWLRPIQKTETLEFRGLDSVGPLLILTGWNSQVHKQQTYILNQRFLACGWTGHTPNSWCVPAPATLGRRAACRPAASASPRARTLDAGAAALAVERSAETRVFGQVVALNN